MVVTAAAGWSFALLNGVRDLPNSTVYLMIATTLLALGLFSSTYDISASDVAGKVDLVLTAVTVGVVVKAALIAAIMYLLYRRPEYFVLGVAVAQIDPLSVAVMRRSSRLSTQGRAILSAWSSFDDPVTAILAVYLSTIALSLGATHGTGQDLLGDYSNAGLNVLFNALFAVAMFGVWLVLRALARRRTNAFDTANPSAWPPWLLALATVVLLIAGAVAVNAFLMLGVAIAGLFFRPGIHAVLRFVSPIALVVAVFMLGMLLTGGIQVVPGLALGLCAFGAQVAVGLILTWSMPAADRIRLALSQQNGITAIILALLLETVFPDTVAVVAPAILVIALLHLISNAIVDRVEDSARKATQNSVPDIDGQRLEFRPEGP